MSKNIKVGLRRETNNPKSHPKPPYENFTFDSPPIEIKVLNLFFNSLNHETTDIHFISKHHVLLTNYF